MKKSIQFFAIGIIAISLFFSCGERHPKNDTVKTSDSTELSSNNDSKIRTQDINNLFGIWVTKKKNKWIEFRSDNTYSMGVGSTVKVEGKKFKFDKKRSGLLIETKNGNKVFFFRFEDNFMYIRPEGKDKDIKYKKADKRPE